MGEPVLLTIPVHGTSMACVREHVYLCYMHPQASCNARVQMSSSMGACTCARGCECGLLSSARPQELSAMCVCNELVLLQFSGVVPVRFVGGSMYK